mmetsp:Transcript_30414/g.42373  ORF Transcript_30414/g.42373 Transcript_30414/m.42373 type:complete len:157 (-) Transcript_30414:120-590(-)
MGGYIDLIISALVKKAADTNKFVAAEATNALSSVVQHGDCKRVLKILVKEVGAGHSAIIKVQIMRTLHLSVTNFGVGVLKCNPSVLPDLVKALAPVLYEKHAECRDFGTKTVVALGEACKDATKEESKEIDQAVKKIPVKFSERFERAFTSGRDVW